MEKKITTSRTIQLSTQTTMLLNKGQSLKHTIRHYFTSLSILAIISLFFCFKANAQSGNALQCSGGYVTATGIDISNASFTIEFWLKHTDDGNFNTAIGQGSTADNHGLHIGLKGGNQFYFNYYNNDFTYATATDGNWHHWACVNDGTTTTRSIYQDGVLVATNNAGSNFLGTGDFYIGQSSFGGGFNGTLDEVRVWSTARTQAEIQASMNSEVSSGTGLLAAYHCNQGVANGDNTSITTLTDATGNYNGTLNSFTLTGTSNNFVGSAFVAGAALDFDGSNDYVDVPDANVLDLGANLTLEAWVKPTSFSTYNMIIDKRLNTDAAANYGLTLTNGKPMFYFWPNTSDVHFHIATNAISLNTWSHIAATYDGATVKIFVNGTQVYSQAETAIPTATNQSLNIGRNPATLQYFSGDIDEVRIWNTARTCDQISQLYSCELAGNESGLVAYYKFNQGVATGDNTAVTSLTDATANGNNGTFNGFALNGSTSNFIATGGVTTGVSCGAVSAPEINLKGNGNNITYGSTTPATNNHTDFGAVSTSLARTFTIENIGAASLTVSSITSSNAKFVVSNIPPSVSAISTATFTVTFNASGNGGLETSTITVTNNDCDESTYTFTVQAMIPFTLGFGCISGTIGNYYNGGAGPNVGVAFTTETASGGSLSAWPSNPIINIPAGFTNGFAVYGDVCIGYAINIYSGLDGTGTLLATQGNSPGVGSLSFSGVAKSVVLARWSCPGNGYDNLTFGSTTIGSALAESTVEINVTGNGNNILDGTATTDANTHTTFGSVAANTSFARTYTIHNTGTGTLTISGITSSNNKYVVSNIPPSVAGNSTATFTVTFNPTASGVQNSTITITNDDCDEASYDFAITGTGFNLYTFNGTTNTDWATASNWSNNAVPSSLSSGDQVVIAANCTMNDVTISFPSGTSLTVNSSRTLSPSLNTYITIASGATLTLNASASMSTGRITNNGTMDIYGNYTAFYMTNNSGGVMNVKSSGSYSCPACAEAMNAGSTINNTGTMHLGTGSTWQCTVNNNVGGIITDGGNGAQIQLGSSSSVVNAGTFVSRTAGTAGSFTNSGTLSTPGTCNFIIKTGATMTNSGNMTFASSDNVLTIQSSASLTNTGTVTNNGTMSVAGTFTNNGTYKGTGTYSGSLFTNPSGGIVAPGNSPGCLTFSNGFTNNGSLQIELGGTTACTQFDKINVTGTATLGGSLTVSLINGYTGTGVDQATIINATALSGSFSSPSLPANWYSNYNAPATGQYTISYNAVLSVELLNFKATPSVSSVKLTWETANEVNNKGFQIERAAQPSNGAFTTWDILGFVNTKGKAAMYDFTDSQPLSTSYYRLRQIDNDGKETLSKVVSISNNKTTKLKVYPSVSSGFLSIETTSTDDYMVVNLLGQLVRTGKTTQRLDVSALPQGTYILRVGAEETKFVKQ